jgi:hypothetical protein
VKTYGRDQILLFLAEIDDLLDEPVAMEIIGGAAALLAYGAQTATKDIDSFLPIDARISRAADLATRKIPLDRAAVADPPWNYEDRLRRLELPFRHLAVVVPDRHDLLLMKALRAARHDEEVIQEMHEVEPFDLKTIVQRYDDEMGQAIGDHQILDLKLELILEKLFGASAARRARKGRRRP